MHRAVESKKIRNSLELSDKPDRKSVLNPSVEVVKGELSFHSYMRNQRLIVNIMWYDGVQTWRMPHCSLIFALQFNHHLFRTLGTCHVQT